MVRSIVSITVAILLIAIAAVTALEQADRAQEDYAHFVIRYGVTTADEDWLRAHEDQAQMDYVNYVIKADG